MRKMQKAKLQTTRTISFTDKKVKCACPGCGISFPRSRGIQRDGELYCTKEHADIAQVIKQSEGK